MNKRQAKKKIKTDMQILQNAIDIMPIVVDKVIELTKILIDSISNFSNFIIDMSEEEFKEFCEDKTPEQILAAECLRNETVNKSL